MKGMITLAILAASLAIANCHTYHMGSCPAVEPMTGFQMNRFLGNWYVIQKTSTASKCISYNYTTGEEPGKYRITQDSNHALIGLTPLKHQYHYTGELTIPEGSYTPALMKVQFPLSIAGSASHIIFDTDYKTYAGIFTCQKIGFFNRRSATILSRTKELDKSHINSLRDKLRAYNVDPYDLNNVPQSNCNVGDDPVNIDINPGTFSAENVGKLFSKAGEKIGDGVEWIVKSGSKVYHKITGTESSSSDTPKIDLQNENTTSLLAERNNEIIESNDVEWIP